MKDQRLTAGPRQAAPSRAEARKQIAYYKARIEEERVKADREAEPRIRDFHLGLIGLYEDCLKDHDRP